LIAQVKSEEGDGILVDAFFVPEWQMTMLQKLSGQKAAHASPIVFEGNGRVRQYLVDKAELLPKIHASDLYNTATAYDGLFFLKLYRKVDRSANPDQELTRFLSGEGKFPYLPAFIGSIEWKDKKGCVVLGLLQEMIENHGDGYGYFQERINNYVERILAGEMHGLLASDRLGTLASPLTFEELPAELQNLLGAHSAEQARLIGVRTAEMHLALAGGTGKDMKPEAFSVHYQRSLYSSVVSLVRETYQNLARNQQSLPADMQERMERILAYRSELLTTLKKIYAHKMEISKIRIHGNFHLAQVLLTGKDLALSDYSGDPLLSFSERRLRRSVFVDLASMIASIFEVAFDGFLRGQQVHTDDARRLLPMAGIWAHYVSGFFVRAYKDRAAGSILLPASGEDFETLLQYFVVQKAMIIFNGYLRKEPQRLVIAQTLLREVLQPLEALGVVAPAASAAAVAPVSVGTVGGAADSAAVVGAGKPATETVQPKPADVVAETVEHGGQVRAGWG
jgi:maltose alpha-D-glucosyltransferase / alpha-amylase